MSEPDERVELTDLDVIARYSLAVRAATADRAELIAALRSDLEWLEGTARRTPPRAPAVAAAPARVSAPQAPARKAPARKVPVKTAPVRKAAANTAAAGKSAAKKAAAKPARRAASKRAAGRRR